MARKYKSRMFQELYNNFAEMFAQEGNCYEAILDSVNNDYEHGKLPPGASKMLIMTILKDVTVDYYKEQITITSETEFLKRWKE